MMKQDAAVPLQSIHADGGAARNRFLMQFTADMLSLELKVSDTPELSPLGAALSGLLGMRVCSSLDDLAALPREFITYRPALDREKADRYYEGWKQAVARIL
jgi:glycerol kinase